MIKFNDIFGLVLLTSVVLFQNVDAVAQDQHLKMINVAGDGTTSIDLSGTPTESGFQAPGAVIVDENNDVFFSSSANSAIFKVDVSENKLEVFHSTSFGLGGTITGLALDGSTGIFYYGKSSLYDRRVWSVDGMGVATPICGDETMAGPGGLEDPVDATLCGAVGGMTIGPNGDLYFIDINYNLIRRIDFAEGKVYRVAGVPISLLLDDTEFESITDGTDALSDTIKPKGGLAINAAGEVFYSTTDHTIRKIAVDGTVTTVAGIAGSSGYDGEGLDALDSRLFAPGGIDVLADGTLLIGDESNNRLRIVNTAGRLFTLAGTGETEGAPGSDGYLVSGQYKAPLEVDCRAFGVYAHSDGAVYFTDTDAKRVRKVVLCTNAEITSTSVSENVICLGDEVTLSFTGDLNDATKWNWFKGSCEVTDFEISNATEVQVTATANESYFIIATGGCTNETECTEVKVDISCKTHFNTFTPNGDGKNDFFEIPGLNNFPINTVTFYNRWGDQLEVVENYDNVTNVWKGTNGTDDDGGDDDNGVDSGTYYFTAVVEGEVLISGWIQVVLTK